MASKSHRHGDLEINLEMSGVKLIMKITSSNLSEFKAFISLRNVSLKLLKHFYIVLIPHFKQTSEKQKAFC